MDPSTSVTRSMNLTYAGIHSIWTGHDLSAMPTSPATSSVRSQSTLVSEIGRPPSQAGHPREPVKQGSAAWTSLRNTQLPTRSHTTPITSSPSPAPPTPERGRESVISESDFVAAIDTVNSRRDQEDHPGKTGQSRLPQTEKAAQRRMILAVCGEREAGNIDR